MHFDPVRLSSLPRGSLVCLDVCLSFTFLGLYTLYSDHVTPICRIYVMKPIEFRVILVQRGHIRSQGAFFEYKLFS